MKTITYPYDTVNQAIGEGLTKREHFAALALQGLCANQHHCGNGGELDMPKLSVELADELIKQLNNE